MSRHVALQVKDPDVEINDELDHALAGVATAETDVTERTVETQCDDAVVVDPVVA